MRCSPVSGSPNVISVSGRTSTSSFPSRPTYTSRPSPRSPKIGTHDALPIFVGRDAVLARLGLPERHLGERQDLDLVVPEQADVYLSPFDQFLHDRGLMVLGVDELDTLREARVILDHRCLGDADRSVLEQRLHD